MGVQEWGKVSAVLFDMDGVLCNSENPSRKAAVDVFAEMGIQCTQEDFDPFTGMGEAYFLAGVAAVKGVKEFDTDAAKKRFFEIYLDKYAKPNSGIGFPGALELITECKTKGLKVAVASSADRVKVDANLAAAGLPISMFDAIVSADAFENLKPAPDIFLAASKILDVSPEECIVIEDAVAGVQAANAANMRCIAVTTTLTEEALKAVGPSFIRNDIGCISLYDILSGGSDKMVQDMQEQNPSTEAQCKFCGRRTRKAENAASIDPLDGKLSPKGSATIHHRRSTSSAFTGMINCKVYYCKEDEVFLYQSLLFGVPFQEEDPESKPADIKLSYDVKLKASTNSLLVNFPPKMLI